MLISLGARAWTAPCSSASGSSKPRGPSPVEFSGCSPPHTAPAGAPAECHHPASPSLQREDSGPQSHRPWVGHPSSRGVHPGEGALLSAGPGTGRRTGALRLSLGSLHRSLHFETLLCRFNPLKSIQNGDCKVLARGKVLYWVCFFRLKKGRAHKDQTFSFPQSPWAWGQVSSILERGAPNSPF